jgi:DNA-binding NtrC family response regulator
MIRGVVIYISSTLLILCTEQHIFKRAWGALHSRTGIFMSIHSNPPLQQLTALFVSPSVSDHSVLRNIFSLRSTWLLQSAYTCSDAFSLLGRESIPVVICDGDLPDDNWRILMEMEEGIVKPPRVIVSSRKVNERLWGEVLQLGGYDLLAMPWDSREVLRAISLAWRSWDLACRTADSMLRQALLNTKPAWTTASAATRDYSSE